MSRLFSILQAAPAPYREAVAFFQAFRALGFFADDVYALFAGHDGNVQLCITLRVNGRDCTAVAGYLQDTVANVVAAWSTVADAVAAGKVSEAELADNWRASMACAQFPSLPFVVMGKGIALPPETMRRADVFTPSEAEKALALALQGRIRVGSVGVDSKRSN